ncbi:InlB B-repeat-containing protein [Paenibacillus sp. IITD108]|uniref:InlB B-repeat-containing protein n=1 Tax=Paenibacillus sp. IITD108 TaxID=3116649 RepID=UPI002F3F06B1
MKRTCMMLLVMAFLIAPFNILPVHADNQSGDFYYTDNADPTTVTITGYTDSAPRDLVVIPQKMDGKTVTAIGDEAFQNKSIQSLELPDGLVLIGTKAFYNNPLTSLEIPGSVKEIGHGAFQLNKLTSLTLNDGVEKIGKNAFTNNDLTALHLPDSVTELGAYAFQRNRLVDLRLSNSLAEISEYAFANNKLISLDIPASVRIIGNSAFSGNRIVELVIPETVTTVKREAFHYNALELVTFLGTPLLEDNMADVNSGFFYQYSDATNSNLYNWYTDPEYAQVWNKTVTANPASPLTIYAAWQRNYVTFNANGGSGGAAKQVDFAQTTTAITSNKTEHNLEGWYKEKELINKWDFDADIVTRNITLYAKWIANTYTVSFQSNGGTAVADQAIAYNGSVVSPTIPSKAEHTFAGWYTSSGLTTPWDFGTDLVKGNMTLYAKWIPNTYTVSFQSNGGTTVVEQVIAYDNRVPSPANPSKTGHTFAGWHTDSDLTAPWNFETGLVKGNMTLYAKWAANTYTVIFQSNGGSAVAAQTIVYDNQITSPVNPGKAGHTFGGWYVDSTLLTPWNFDTGLVKGDMRLYAKWMVNTYTVSFQSDGGSAVADQTIAYDGIVVSPINPSKPGHTFAGWYTNSDLTTAWNFNTGLVKGDMTLYAKWKANTYTVSFQSNGGSAVAEQVIVYDDKVVLSAPPIKTGYSFVDWYKDEELTTLWMFATDIVTENMTLYAEWEKEIYTVSFETTGGSEITDQRVAFEESAVLPANPKKSGYNFAGWFKDEDLTLAWDFTTNVVIADMTLYAKWSKIIYVTPSEPIIEPEPTVEPEPIQEEEPVQHACSAKFTDISSHWAKNAITDMASRCIIIGYPDGEFKPDDPIIRAHVAVMFTRALELSPNRPLNRFYDISNNSPYYEAIMKVSLAGIFEGANGYFYPDQHLTRAQMAKILVIAFNLPTGGKSTFQDVPKTHWGYPYIAALESYGLALGENGYYKPEEPVTRAQFVTFMKRALQL